MRFLWLVLLWRWNAVNGKRLARAASRAHQRAARYRELAYTDAEGHAERIGFMRAGPKR